MQIVILLQLYFRLTLGNSIIFKSITNLSHVLTLLILLLCNIILNLVKGILSTRKVLRLLNP